LPLFPGVTARGEQGIVQPAAFLKLGCQEPLLPRIRIPAILEGLPHVGIVYASCRRGAEASELCIPRPKGRSLLAPYWPPNGKMRADAAARVFAVGNEGSTKPSKYVGSSDDVRIYPGWGERHAPLAAEH